uniref:RRM domain-containing protein n=1 Tax=Meloidogyne hapla TaxID=6305 RepID=A0A1I8BYC6_MELHA
MKVRHDSEESFSSCHSSPSIHEHVQELQSNTSSKRSRRSTEEQHVLAVKNLKGRGKVIQLRDLFYVFNLNARADDDKPDNIDNVIDIRFLSDCTIIKMLTKDAACRAKSALNESWLFDKFIKVDWASIPQCQLFHNSNKPPLAQAFRRRNDSAKRRQRQAGNRVTTNANRRGDYDNCGDVDDIQAQLAYYVTNLPSKRTRFLRPGTGLNEVQNLSYVRHYSDKKNKKEDKQGSSSTINSHNQHSPHKRFINSVCTRTVARDRCPPSPVLEVEGLEYSGDLGNNILARTDLITLFTFCGVVKDIDIGYCKQDNIVEKCFGSCKHRALVQMENVEQATRAINEFDHSWQMGRFILVTYSVQQCIEHDRNINRRDRYSHRRFVQS